MIIMLNKYILNFKASKKQYQETDWTYSNPANLPENPWLMAKHTFNIIRKFLATWSINCKQRVMSLIL